MPLSRLHRRDTSTANAIRFPRAWQELTKFDAAWLICSEPARIIRSTPETQQIRHAAAYIHKLYAVVGEGGDNHTFRAACKLRDAGWSVEESLAVLAEGNETNADPPWSEVELRYKIASAFGRNK